ncbi:defensin-like protein 1 [Lactuca sativa]|uniref:defensin-like protein 1 n=1 Tax=Lactuca sativa TaxID=4236 RepID=UPI000CB7F2E0|nr:defensin-like protein 1 [Lactuca sativa]
MATNTFAIFFTLLLIFSSQWTIPGAEARVCQSLSHMYHGSCLRHHNCSVICRNEGFSGGRCKGVRRRCFCTKLC